MKIITCELCGATRSVRRGGARRVPTLRDDSHFDPEELVRRACYYVCGNGTARTVQLAATT